MSIWVSIGMYIVYLIFRGTGSFDTNVESTSKAQEQPPQIVNDIKEFYNDSPDKEQIEDEIDNASTF